MSSLSSERESLSFNSKNLVGFIHSNPTLHNAFLRIQSTIDISKDLIHDPNIFGKTRLEKFEDYIKIFHKFNKQFDFNSEVGLLATVGIYKLPFILGVHRSMFVPCLENLANEEQLSKWLPLTITFRMIGCYAQTEIGHGSDLQSLETTAELDLNSDEFIIDSPTLTSIKFWPGDLGVFANHAMVFAQMNIKGAHCGLQAFLVQIRDFETNEPLPGIEVGDIGPKYGYVTKDNGFLKFNKVRIPRTNLLMKYIKVDRDGVFTKIGNDKILYGIMMKIRTIISCDSVGLLSQGLTIAIRYSIVRKQFKNKTLDYILQMDKLITILAQTFAIIAAAEKTRFLVNENYNLIKLNDFSQLNETHIALAATKSYNSTSILLGLEKCRLACGGHGFSHYSGLPTMIQEYAPNCTFEGDNTVMYLQVARYLIKNFEKASRNRELAPNVKYLERFRILENEMKAMEINKVNLVNVKELLTFQAIYCVKDAAQTMMENVSTGMSMKESWDKKCGLRLVEAAKNHTILYTYTAFFDRINKIREDITLNYNSFRKPDDFPLIDSNCLNVLEKLCLLYGINSILTSVYPLLEIGVLNEKGLSLLIDEKELLLKSIRPDAIGLVDCFEWSDNTLQSALGKYDGNVYEELFRLASQHNSFKKECVNEGLETLRKLKNVQSRL